MRITLGNAAGRIHARGIAGNASPSTGQSIHILSHVIDVTAARGIVIGCSLVVAGAD